MNTCTYKPTQEVYIHVMGGRGESFHSIIYIMPAVITINSVSHTHAHAHAHTHTHTHTN